MTFLLFKYCKYVPIFSYCKYVAEIKMWNRVPIKIKKLPFAKLKRSKSLLIFKKYKFD